MKVKSAKELQQKARLIFSELDETYLLCEGLFIVSELVKMQSIALLERGQEAN